MEIVNYQLQCTLPQRTKHMMVYSSNFGMKLWFKSESEYFNTNPSVRKIRLKLLNKKLVDHRRQNKSFDLRSVPPLNFHHNQFVVILIACSSSLEKAYCRNMRLNRVKCEFFFYKFICDMQPFTVISMHLLLLKYFCISQYLKDCISLQARLSSLSIGMNWQHRETRDVDIHYGAAIMRCMRVMLVIIYND